MRTESVTTVNELHARYAHRLAHVAGLNVAGYAATAVGLAELCRDVANRLSTVDPNRDWVEEIADHFSAVSLLGEDNREAQRLLDVIGNTLSEAVSELEIG